MKHIVLKSLIAASIVALGAGFAQAQQENAASNKLQVQVEIVTGCTVNFPDNSGNVNFGQYSAITTSLVETRRVVVNCNNGGPAAGGTTPTNPVMYTLALDNGENGGSSSTRRLRTGSGASASYLNYNVFQAANQASKNCGGTIWGSTTGETFSGKLTATATATSNSVSGDGIHYFNVCIPAQATPTLGTYMDVLTATLSY